MTKGRRFLRYGGAGFGVMSLAQLPMMYALDCRFGFILMVAASLVGLSAWGLSFRETQEGKATK